MLLKISIDSNLLLWILRLWLRGLFAWLFQCKVLAAEPSFRVPPENVTAIEGDVAVLPCSINHLTDEHNVVWTDEGGFVLTLNEKRVIDDQRLSVERPFKRYWNLHIRDVQHSDRGKYVCQINTKPSKHREVVLDVLVPPYIVEKYSSKDKMTVREGDTVTLVCNATGYPQPEIRWFRYTSEHMRVKEKIGKSGEVLIIHNVSRECGGTYICEADNDVDEIETKEITLNVQYAPEVILPSAKLGHFPGKETFLQCRVAANPLGLMIWERGGQDLVADTSGKYMVEVFDLDDEKIISLRIREIQIEDFGEYTCYAENFVGKDKETMILYDYSKRLQKPTTSTTFKPFYITEPEIAGPYDIGAQNENQGESRSFISSSGVARASVCHVIFTLMNLSYIMTFL